MADKLYVLMQFEISGRHRSTLLQYRNPSARAVGPSNYSLCQREFCGSRVLAFSKRCSPNAALLTSSTSTPSNPSRFGITCADARNCCNNLVSMISASPVAPTSGTSVELSNSLVSRSDMGKGRPKPFKPSSPRKLAEAPTSPPAKIDRAASA